MNFPKPGVNFHDFSRPGKEKWSSMTFPGFHDWIHPVLICWRFVCLSKLLCESTLWMTRNTCGVRSHASPFRASQELADVTIKLVNITLKMPKIVSSSKAEQGDYAWNFRNHYRETRMVKKKEKEPLCKNS